MLLCVTLPVLLSSPSFPVIVPLSGLSLSLLMSVSASISCISDVVSASGGGVSLLVPLSLLVSFFFHFPNKVCGKT